MIKLPSEIEEGNIEYKLKLTTVDEMKIYRLKSQMLWRLEEGFDMYGIREAIYYIGVSDNGEITGLNKTLIEKSINVFKKIIRDLNITIHKLEILPINELEYIKIIIRKIEYENKENIRVGFIGKSGSGKTTLIGVITHGELDNGNGSSRLNILRYNHEINNGLTSSIRTEIIGYNNNKIINYNSNIRTTWEEIYNKSTKLIDLIDMPGFIKYIKTTLYGILSYKPNLIIIVIDINDLIDNKITNDDILMNITLCNKLEIKYTIVITKTDIIDNKDLIDFSINQLKEILNNNKINTEFNINTPIYNKNINIFTISNKTGYGINLLEDFINNIKITNNTITDNTEFIINDIFYIPEIGNVVLGLIVEGNINLDEDYLIGPINNKFYPIKIKSIHKNQIPVKILNKNNLGSIIIECSENITIDKHLKIVDKINELYFCNNFKIKFNYDINLNYFLENSIIMMFCDNIYDKIYINNIYFDTNIISVNFLNYKKYYLIPNRNVIIRNNSDLFYGLIYYDT